MVPHFEATTRPRQWVIAPELLSLRFRASLAIFWVLRRALHAMRLFARALGFVFSVVFGRYEMVKQVGPGLPGVPVRPATGLEDVGGLGLGPF
ncbi:MAG: hypothetical protein K2X47_15530 [Bdellovibrionales bacterium]|nr:hypothetical protein [Bdellovibrionales bacterium]